MRRFFVTPDAVSDEFIRITAPEDISHISKVLRMKVEIFLISPTLSDGNITVR